MTAIMKFECELMDTMDRTPTGDGNASGQGGVFELLGVGDYILEAELSLYRPIGMRLRMGQQEDLRQVLVLIEDAASMLPEGPLKNWAALLYNRAWRCLRQVGGHRESALHAEGVEHPCHHGSPAA